MSPTAKLLLSILAKVTWRLVRGWAHKKGRVRGEWRGQYKQLSDVDDVAATAAGYRSGTPCKLAVNDLQDDPRRWVHESGWEYALETPVVSDGGSTPGIARERCKEWADLDPFGTFIDEFLFHDAGYKWAGCWVRKDANSEWVWVPLTRAQVDTLLFQQMPSSGGRRGESNAVFRAVRLFAGRAWRAHRRRGLDAVSKPAIVSSVKRVSKPRRKKESL